MLHSMVANYKGHPDCLTFTGTQCIPKRPEVWPVNDSARPPGNVATSPPEKHLPGPARPPSLVRKHMYVDTKPANTPRISTFRIQCLKTRQQTRNTLSPRIRMVAAIVLPVKHEAVWRNTRSSAPDCCSHVSRVDTKLPKTSGSGWVSYPRGRETLLSAVAPGICERRSYSC